MRSLSIVVPNPREILISSRSSCTLEHARFVRLRLQQDEGYLEARKVSHLCWSKQILQHTTDKYRARRFAEKISFVCYKSWPGAGQLSPHLSARTPLPRTPNKIVLISFITRTFRRSDRIGTKIEHEQLRAKEKRRPEWPFQSRQQEARRIKSERSIPITLSLNGRACNPLLRLSF